MDGPFNLKISCQCLYGNFHFCGLIWHAELVAIIGHSFINRLSRKFEYQWENLKIDSDKARIFCFGRSGGGGGGGGRGGS